MKTISAITALLAVAWASVAVAQDNTARGKSLFEAQCSSCHTVTPGQHGFGPSLAGVTGRQAGTVAGYKFTGAMTNSGLRWDPKNLDEFLGGSTKKVPGTAMDFAITAAADRAAIIAYLGTVGGGAAVAPVAVNVPAPPARPHGGPTQEELLGAAGNPRDWIYATRDYAGTRFADLKQINTRNVAQLRPVCLYRTDIAAPTQTNPLVYDGIMYATFENSVVAIDAATCRERWTYKWNPKGRSVSLSNRGVAIKDGVLVRGTSDGHLIALDMDQGRLIWSRKIADAEEGQYLSMPPLMFEDMVIFGPAGADWGPKNWVGAFRIASGEPVWRFNLIPDVGEPGSETWINGASIEHGGGSLWTPLSFDAVAGTLYLPVGNPAPDFYGALRPGENLYTNSAVALDVRTGKPLWYKQFVPHDIHDTDLSQVSPLFSASIRGKERKLMTVSGKDGLLRVMDRDTREIMFELPITTRSNVDVAPTVEGIHRCPGLLGGMEWNGPTYDPLSKTLFASAVDWCGTFKISEEPPTFQPATHYYGGAVIPDPRETAHGWLTAIDAINGKIKWQKQWATPLAAALVSTSGGLVFTGDMNDDFIALDAANGNVLYRFNTGGSIGGGVVTYQVKGKQYIATTSGVVSGFFGGSGPSMIAVLALP